MKTASNFNITCNSFLQELDTALLKLYAELNSLELESLIVSFQGNASDCENWLAKYGHHHAMALLYQCKGSHDQALSIWARWGGGEEWVYGF